PLFRVIVPVTEKLIVSPSTAFAIASRSRQFAPGQFAALAAPSPKLVTVMVLAITGAVIKRGAVARRGTVPNPPLAAAGENRRFSTPPACAAALPCRCQDPRPSKRPRTRTKPAMRSCLFIAMLLEGFRLLRVRAE